MRRGLNQLFLQVGSREKPSPNVSPTYLLSKVDTFLLIFGSFPIPATRVAERIGSV